MCPWGSYKDDNMCMYTWKKFFSFFFLYYTNITKPFYTFCLSPYFFCFLKEKNTKKIKKKNIDIVVAVACTAKSDRTKEW